MSTHTAPHFRLSPVLGESLTPSPTLYINERVQEMWAAGQEVLHLAFGESRFPVHPKLAQALAENAHRKSYLPGPGIPELRAAVAGFYSRRLGIRVQPEQVITAPGSKALLYAFQMAVDGDLILPTPTWVSYAPQARLLGKEVLTVPANPATGHDLTIENLRRTVARSRHDQHELILTTPNNPSSRMTPQELLSALADFCREANVLVLSDEIYGFVPHNHVRHHSIVEYYPEGTVILGGLSKHLSVGGWRLGVAVVPPGEMGQTLLRAVNKIGSEIWSCASAPVSYAAVVAYSGDPEIEAYIDECAHLHSVRTQYFWRGLAELDISCARPQGGFYLFPNFDRWRPALAARGVHTSEDLSRYLLEKWHIATLPGSVFGTPPEELSLRFATSYVDMETDEKAWRILELHRAGVDDDTLMREHHPGMNEALRRIRLFLEELHA